MGGMKFWVFYLMAQQEQLLVAFLLHNFKALLLSRYAHIGRNPWLLLSRYVHTYWQEPITQKVMGSWYWLYRGRMAFRSMRTLYNRLDMKQIWLDTRQIWSDRKQIWLDVDAYQIWSARDHVRTFLSAFRFLQIICISMVLTKYRCPQRTSTARTQFAYLAVQPLSSTNLESPENFPLKLGNMGSREWVVFSPLRYKTLQSFWLNIEKRRMQKIPT